VLCTNSVSVDQWRYQFTLWSTLQQEQVRRPSSHSGLVHHNTCFGSPNADASARGQSIASGAYSVEQRHLTAHLTAGCAVQRIASWLLTMAI